MTRFNLPQKISNWFGRKEVAPHEQKYFPKFNPHSGEEMGQVPRSSEADVHKAIENAQKAFTGWANTPSVKRGMILFEIAQKMQEYTDDFAQVVALEGGKAFEHAKGEVGAAIQQAFFMAGEGQRMFGRTTGSNLENRIPITLREPVGVCALIVASNTPIANIAWKVFPALICGNSVVLKASEDTPYTAWLFGKILAETSLPDGVVNIINGNGAEVGDPLIQHRAVDLVSFTGSTRVGKHIAETTGRTLKKSFFELGGKNPMVICDDADLDNAVNWAVASSFSNAGQRCAASSRIIIFDSIYDRFMTKFVEKTKKLTLGTENHNDLGPVVNKRQQENILNMIDVAKQRGAKITCGGTGGTQNGTEKGFYITPTIIENVGMDWEISRVELFGPVTCVYRARDLSEAIEMANDCDYGLTSSIHTKDYNRAFTFSKKVQAGVAGVNGGTHGSEPHIPFGGIKESGAGGREPGTEALDVYSNLKVMFNNFNPEQIG